jgi:hypothetical protein
MSILICHQEKSQNTSSIVNKISLSCSYITIPVQDQLWSTTVEHKNHTSLTLTLRRHRSRVNKNNRLIAAEAAVEELTAELAVRNAELDAAKLEIDRLHLQAMHLTPTQHQATRNNLLKMRFAELHQPAPRGFIEEVSPAPSLTPQRMLPAPDQQQQLSWDMPNVPQYAPFPSAPQHNPGYVNPADLDQHEVQYTHYYAQ